MPNQFGLLPLLLLHKHAKAGGLGKGQKAGDDDDAGRRRRTGVVVVIVLGRRRRRVKNNRSNPR